ncbi:hypothetical protein COY13_01345 [Candidatus Roizmanbacteria bacterium CG_4_10_14_0_2_um_filter_36_35]|uniref:PIN domain-containing protein n=4 Tax=Candidatus Roizmaniibacteriota TaxID=1752723 RepID=A0A2M7BVN3_9BACT|nr:MAG: hypothetical protein COV86_04930 [Candidatus Roizmanbacteria bacterium CG11_big_fil_rev_8_21_14_0_20_35_14]PIV10599.1 MAG: hypothetical protein COS50_04610 [Candidatus Roizmanbacteria bacterium CG03_land_8_20_14_0_80_35_26]PIZ68398.1 MAG: hypothetical protein COY13_01345 [Candidatus Roizmanbacteria bacterium CG_4_10_14_0_2_um_filter_36_35]PJC33271.1 MAG: hypothetical protein CO049_00870 [Candidatus Roizmanbacteria bacterium CG_4_9_14_0_2_um_filter_36_12]PJC80277.1 MAG: hypothetical prot
MIFVDTNYFLRYFLDDGSDQHKKATLLLISASKGEKNLTTSTLVIFEIFWVLGSVYKLGKEKKTEIIENLVNMTFVELKERDLLQKALRIYKLTKLQLEDCYNLVFFQENKIDKFATFDKKLKKLIGKFSCSKPI